MSIVAPDLAVSANAILTPNLEGYTLEAMNWIELVNASAFPMQAQFGSLIFQVPAWYSYPVNLRGSTGNLIPGIGTPKLTVGAAQTIPGTAGVATLHTTLYLVGESPANTQPGPLGGSPINLSIATQVVNAGNPAGTSIVFGAPLTDTGATIILNNGVATFGDTAYPGSVTISNGNEHIALTSGLFAMYDIVGNLLASIDQNAKLILGSAGEDGQLALLMNGSVLNGTTSGTATLYQWMRGTVKVSWIELVNFRNGAAGVGTLPLPVAYTSRAIWRTGNTSPLNGLASSVAQNFGIITTLAAAGGSVTVQTQLNKFSIADQINPIDTISFLGGQAGTYDGLIIIEGV